jgi:zinc transport system ATP-binding protein
VPHCELDRCVPPPAESRDAVVFGNVSVRLDGVPILDGVTASVPKGGSTAVVGPNGAGKTTLLMALLRHTPFDGDIRIAAAGDKPPRIGYVPQRLQFDRGLPMTVRDFLVMGLQRRPLWLGIKRIHRERAVRLLADVRGEALEGRMLGVLSGGELQRVLLALALAQDPDLLVLDEPASGVDIQGGLLFCELLERLRRERGFTQLMVSHDLATVTHHATHVILLNRRVIAEGPPREVLTPAHLAAVFGMHMGLADARSLAEGKSACSCAKCEENSHG